MRFDNLFDIRQWFKNIFNSIIDYLSDRKEGNNKKIIKNILKTIEENYSKNLTISDIANEIYLSPNYVGIIFKKEMGESFTDFLVRVRLEKAKKMLKETPLKVYQIGGMVGYSNISYFCSIFKNSYGMSPSEYREKT
jgi:two-component system, response regulator YesN